LDRNFGIRTLLVEEDEVPVSETWEEGAAADAVLILLDGVSAPAPLRREAWTGLIEHDGDPPIAFARMEDCAYPKLLERRLFFPADDLIVLERAVERWVTAKLPSRPGFVAAGLRGEIPEDWWPSLVDRPGSVTTQDAAAAQAFAQQAASHFQGVVWIGCAGREPALIRAELDHRTSEGRMLAVLAHSDKPLKFPEGRHSYLQILGAPAEGATGDAIGACYAPGFPGWFARELGGDLTKAILLDATNDLYRLAEIPPADTAARMRHMTILHRYFQAWKTHPEPCRALLNEAPAAIQYGFEEDWLRATELCRRTAFLLLGDGRRREGIRLFHRLLVEAEERGDAAAAADARHELSWLTDEDGPVLSGITVGEQLALGL
jgi:hypothetical protein